MKGFNRAIIMGNLTRDPEIRYTQSNMAVGNFSVACNRSVKQPDGTYQDAADFINVVVFGKSAEFVQKYFHKGSAALVEGRIQTRSYEKDGQKKYVTEVVADNVQFAGSGSAPQNDATAGGTYNAAPASAPQQYQPAPQQYQGGYQAAPQPQYYQNAAPGQQYRQAAPVQEFPMDISAMTGGPAPIVQEANIPF